jgi:hypothetical protein
MLIIRGEEIETAIVLFRLYRRFQRKKERTITKLAIPHINNLLRPAAGTIEMDDGLYLLEHFPVTPVLAQSNPVQNSRITPMKLIEHHHCHCLKDGQASVSVVPRLSVTLQRPACTPFIPTVRRQTVKLRVHARSGL